MWHVDHFSLVVHLVDAIGRDDCVCLAWSQVINQTLTGCMKMGTPFSHWLVRHTVFPIYGHHPVMNSSWFNTFHCQKSDNASLLLNRRILQCEGHPVLSHTAVSIGRRFLSEPLLSPAHAPIHAEDNRIPRCLVMFPYSGKDRYVNGYVIMTFCTFSFEQPLYIRYQDWSNELQWYFVCQDFNNNPWNEFLSLSAPPPFFLATLTRSSLEKARLLERLQKNI